MEEERICVNDYVPHQPVAPNLPIGVVMPWEKAAQMPPAAKYRQSMDDSSFTLLPPLTVNSLVADFRGACGILAATRVEAHSVATRSKATKHTFIVF